MQKWEYGFLTFDEEIIKEAGFFKGGEGNHIALFNGIRIMNIAIPVIFGSTVEGAEKQIKQLEQLAFNELGDMGWELASYNAYANVTGSSGSIHSKKERIIVFKRLKS